MLATHLEWDAVLFEMRICISRLCPTKQVPKSRDSRESSIWGRDRVAYRGILCNINKNRSMQWDHLLYKKRRTWSLCYTVIYHKPTFMLGNFILGFTGIKLVRNDWFSRPSLIKNHVVITIIWQRPSLQEEIFMKTLGSRKPPENFSLWNKYVLINLL